MVRAMRTARRDPAKNAIFLATTVSSGERKQFMYLEEAWKTEEHKMNRENEEYSELYKQEQDNGIDVKNKTN